MAGDAEMQPAGSESLSDLASLLDAEGSDEEQLEQGEEAEEEEEGQEGEEQEEEGEQPEEEEQPKEDPTVVIKHDGKEVTLKQSEVIELAQKGFDYSQKTMAVAEERKQAEALQAQANEFRQHNEKALGATLDRLNAFVQFMDGQVGTPPPIELAQHDAAAFLAQKQLYEDRKGQLTRAHEAIANVQNEAQRQRQEWISRQAGETEKALRDTLPGFDDSTIDDLAAYLGKVGITPQTADVAFVQKGIWELAQKAKAYDALQAEKAKLKPVAQLAKVHKPSASNQPNRKQVNKADAFKRFDASPSLVNLANLL